MKGKEISEDSRQKFVYYKLMGKNPYNGIPRSCQVLDRIPCMVRGAGYCIPKCKYPAKNVFVLGRFTEGYNYDIETLKVSSFLDVARTLSHYYNYCY